MRFSCAVAAVFLTLAGARAEGTNSAQSGAATGRDHHGPSVLPSTSEIARARIFPEQLRPSRAPSEEENHALLQAISRFVARTNRDDVAPLTAYMERFPGSAWETSLRTELGCEYFRTGWYSKALQSWEQVWGDRAHAGPSPAQMAVHRAGSHLATLYARLGRMAELYQLLPQLDELSMTGGNAERVRSAKDGLWSMEHTPEVSFRCGPLALNHIRSHDNPTNGYHAAILNSKSTTNGMSLAEIAGLSAELGMNYQMAYRTRGAELIVPAVVHWQVGHYAALIRRRHGLCLTQDPTFGDDAWISEAALDHEGSGYFLVPPGALPAGWRPVPAAEGQVVFGKGTTQSSNPDATTPYDNEANSCPPRGNNRSSNMSSGMATWNAHLMLVSQEIVDTPVGYQPPFGPPVFTTMRFVQRVNQRFGDLYNHWFHNWDGLLYDDVLNPDDNIRINIEGGWLTFVPDAIQTNVFHCKMRNPGVLLRASPTNYVWQFPDGTRRIYSTPSSTNNGTIRLVVLTGIEDGAGNRVSIGLRDYSGVFSLTDPLGQVTQFFYELADPGTPPSGPNYFTVGSDYAGYITRIVDPFGRTAQFQYAQVIRSVQGFCQFGTCPFYYYGFELTNIVDTAGLSSKLSYTNDYVRTLTTPYGTTTFDWSAPSGRTVVLQVTDPNGDRERIEYSENPNVNLPFAEVFTSVPQGMPTWNRFLYSRNTYHWDKAAFARGFATNDYSKARIYHFAHDYDINAAGGLLESTKLPLENRVWFNYPGQPLPTVPGTGDQPVKIGRVLDDGTTQLQQFERNSLGNITRSIDPAGRTLSFLYASNDVDLLEIRQTRASNNELLLQTTYDSRHLPLSLRDAAGQTTRFSYNSRGQMTGVTNARNESVTFSYDVNGYLIAADGPLPGLQDQTTFTYDAAGRLRTFTDQDSYTLTIDYDALDRYTKITFPDGTYEQIIYDRLKPGVFRDRLGRQTTLTYTSLQQIALIQDALGRVTRFDWCGCGSLESVIDPLGRMTRWRHDIQGRLTAKEYADGSKVAYDYEQGTSRLRQVRDEQGQLTQFSYHPDDSLREQRYVKAIIPTPSVQFTYDPDYLRVATMVDGNGTTTFSYQAITPNPSAEAGKLIAIDGPWANDTTTFTYDELGRTSSRAINGMAVRRTFDAAGRLTQMTNALGAFAFAWVAGSERLSSVHYPNGQNSDYAYYPNAQDQLLQRVTHRLPNNALLSEFTYGYDAAGQITNWTQLQGGTVKAWAPNHDAADRLLGVTESVSGSAPAFFSYGYDAADNRTTAQESGITRDFTGNGLNQVAAIGNSVLAAAGYEWDAQHRLVAATNGTHRTEFSYDGLDRRTGIVEMENGVVVSERRYLWSGLQLCEERDGTGSITLKRFSSLGVNCLAGSDLPPGNYFFTRDSLASVREMCDQAGNVRGQFGYSPFGTRSRLGGDLEPGSGFAGLPLHLPTSLHLARYRAYDSGQGRWLNRDPIGEAGGLNLYAYVLNNPVNFLDPAGLRAPTSFSEWVDLGKDIGGGFIDNWIKDKGKPGLCYGSACVGKDGKPQASASAEVAYTVNGQKVVQLEAEGCVGVKTEGTASDPIFEYGTKFKLKVLKFFHKDVEIHGDFGQVVNYHGQTREMNRANNTINGGEIAE